MPKPDRRSIRLKGYDYSQPGAYFVTICVHQREPRLGHITNGHMVLNANGELAANAWNWVEDAFANIVIDLFCIMPNHTHAIITIHDGPVVPDHQGQQGPTPPPKPRHNPEPPSTVLRPTLGQVVAWYKYATTKHINASLDSPGTRFWQRSFFEHIVRNRSDYENIWQYIEFNPQNWEEDNENGLIAGLQ